MNSKIFIFITLVSVSIFMLSCSKDSPTSSCGNLLLDYERILIEGDKLIYQWQGPESLDIVLTETGKSDELKKLTSFGYTELDSLNLNTNYTLKIYKRCYPNRTFLTELYKTYTIKLCNIEQLVDYTITRTLTGDFLLKFKKDIEATAYKITLIYPFGQKEFFTTKSDFFQFSAIPGYDIILSIAPICKEDWDFYVSGQATEITFNTGNGVLSTDLPPKNTVCLPINCDSSKLDSLIMPFESFNQEIKYNYFYDDTSTCRIDTYRIIPKSDPKNITDIYITVTKNNSGQIRAYYRSEYCSSTQSQFKLDGFNQIIKTFDQSTWCQITFYNTYYTIFTSKNISVYR